MPPQWGAGRLGHSDSVSLCMCKTEQESTSVHRKEKATAGAGLSGGALAGTGEALAPSSAARQSEQIK